MSISYYPGTLQQQKKGKKKEKKNITKFKKEAKIK